MTKYKSNQCPNCGCYKFERDKRSVLTFHFIHDAFIVQQDLLREYGLVHCVNCAVNINNPESIKQCKVVLAY